MMDMPWGRPLYFLSIACFIVMILEIIWRISLVIRYKPVQSVSDDELPTCTVVVPAFNEGRQVMDTLKSLAASNYPKNKLQIIAVDDGSQDDTWGWIQKAKQELGGRVQAIRLLKNRGKRCALSCGFKKSTGSILVTVDSDSMVNADTLRNLTSPFVISPRTGAIAGNIRILNCHKGIIPRMLDVIFVFSFEFMRTSQSMVKTVMCTPGALSAYRRDILMTVVKEWLDQTFFGQPAKIGEDRAMTNLILREGYDVLFQKNAVVYTEVPTTYSNLCKMYLRWSRSNIRESIAMSRFAFKPFRKDCLMQTRINLLLCLRALILTPLFIFVTWGLIFWQPVHFGTNTLVSIVIFSSIPAGFYGWKHSSFSAFWSYAYGFFWFFALIWIMPYAMITPHKSAWLTRQVKPRPNLMAYSFKGIVPSTFTPSESKEG
ncbi:MAG: glycosyltransferase [Proteobacteria bacterium]|nr:glycosyltransferase [Pseudomonadota bacterium]